MIEVKKQDQIKRISFSQVQIKQYIFYCLVQSKIKYNSRIIL